MSFSKILYGLLACAVLFPAAAFSQENSRLDKLELELKELKEQNKNLKERVDSIESDSEEVKHGLGVLSKLVDVSGYADLDYTVTSQPGATNKFRLHHMSLFFTKDIHREWKFFSEVEFEDGPKIVSDTATDTVKTSQGTLFLEQMYIEYHPSYLWDVRVGRFLTPAGIWSIYHYPPFVPVQTGPLFNKIIFPEVSDGIQLRNSFQINDSLLDTNLYAANGSGNPGSTDRNQNKAVGARVNFDVQRRFSAGASYFREKDNSDVMKNSFGAHMLLTFSNLRLQTEYEIRHNKPAGRTSFNDLGAYALLTYDLGPWTIAGRYDWYDSNDKVSGNSHTRYTGALNYHFSNNVVAKAEFNQHQFSDPALKDYKEGILAIAVAFGDL